MRTSGALFVAVFALLLAGCTVRATHSTLPLQPRDAMTFCRNLIDRTVHGDKRDVERLIVGAATAAPDKLTTIRAFIDAITGGLAQALGPPPYLRRAVADESAHGDVAQLIELWTGSEGVSYIGCAVAPNADGKGALRVVAHASLAEVRQSLARFRQDPRLRQDELAI